MRCLSRRKVMYPLRLRRRCDERHGTTAVEAALVLPVYLLFVLAILEFGHAVMVNNVMRSACRQAARLGSTEGQSSADVQARVEQILSGAVDPDKVDIFVKNADIYDQGNTPADGEAIEALPDIELSDAQSRQLFLVRAKVRYHDVAILPIEIPYLGQFLKLITLEGQAFMRHE